jgi:hypothetical protein
MVFTSKMDWKALKVAEGHSLVAKDRFFLCPGIIIHIPNR